MEFRVLGPLTVSGDGRDLPIRGRHHPRLLAILLDQANRVVPVDRLIAGLWDGTPPESARQQIQNVVASLRRQLDDSGQRLETVGSGYRINVAPHELDLLRCKTKESEASRLREAGRPEGAGAALRSALDEWRGPAMADLEGRMIEAAARRLEEYRLALQEEWIDIELELERDPTVELRQLTADHPLRQRFTEQLMLALHRSGRTPEALQLYAELRERLADALGADPGERLRDLHTAILREDRSRSDAAAAPSVPLVPALLPPDIAAFTGRCEELASLDALLDADAARLAVLTGTGGVGKTTLAVRWAHLVADRFPDGQLFVNLRGFEPDSALNRAAMAPEAAAAVLLDALGVPHERIPADSESRFGLYRSMMAERRTLVLLDNAADAAQVRPLIPGGSGNVTLVTSRNPLFGLLAAQGAQAHPVEELSTVEARSLLEQRLGAARVGAEPEAVERIIERCARLPLALAVAAAKAAARPRLRLEVLVGELEAAAGLDAFSGDDAATDVRAVFACSYRGLDPEAARLFRLLGLHPGPDLSASAAASLLAGSVEDAQRSLRVLVREHLLAETVPGRYAFHDLLRAYATELVRGEAEREDATRRMFDHYVQNGRLAHDLAKADKDFFAVDPPLSGVVIEEFADLPGAMAWFGTERSTFLAVIDRAAATGRESIAWQLAWAFKEHVFRQGNWHDGLVTQRTVLEAAQRTGDLAAQMHAHRTLAVVLGHIGERERARLHLEQALALWTDGQEPLILIRIHLGLTHMLGRMGDHRGAVVHGRHALDVARRVGDERNEGRAMSALAWYYAELGRLDEASEFGERAHEIERRFDAKIGMAGTLDTLGVIRHRQGFPDLASACFDESLEIAGELDHRWLEAETLEHVGDLRLDLGDAEAAREAWRGAFERYEELGMTDTGRRIVEKLDRLGADGG